MTNEQRFYVVFEDGEKIDLKWKGVKKEGRRL